MSSSFFTQVRLAARSLGRQPGFVAVAILTLALGIGSVSAIFSVVNGVLLKPLPYPDAERIVRINKDQPPFTGPVAKPVLGEWREATRGVFSAVGAFTSATPSLSGNGDPERLQAYRVTPEFWDVMALAPLHGRYFTQAEEGSGERVVVLSHAFWQRRFGADPALVGQDIVLDGAAHRVVGITHDVFRYPATTDVYLPTFLPAAPDGRGRSYLSVLARLAPGATLEQADQRLARVNASLAEQFPAQHTNYAARLTRLPELLNSAVREPLLILMAASALVLLIACANLANLLLARGSQRQRELAVRAALGAGRSSLVRAVLIEAMLIALAGGGLGVALAAVAVPLLLAGAPQLMPSHSAPGVDAIVVAVSLALALATVTVFALLPAIRAARTPPSGALQEEGRGGSGGRQRARARSLLVALEVALSLTLLVGAGLLIESLRRLGEVDVGVDPAHVLTAAIVLPAPEEIPGEEPEAEWLRASAHYASRLAPLTERLRAIPGVQRVALTDTVPMGGGAGPNSSVEIVGQPPRSGAETAFAMWRFADADYFQALGIPLLRGRTFDAGDLRGGEWPSGIVVNETFARQYLGDTDPIGQQVTNLLDGAPKTIIGVVADTRLFGREADVPPETYLPLTSAISNHYQIVLKLHGEPADALPLVRDALRQFDPNMPVLRLRSMEEVIAGGAEMRQFNLRLMLAFGGIALALAALGIYAVIAYSVAQRRHELGIRMSLGADTGKVMALVMGEGLRVIAFGLLLGLGGALALGRLLAHQLFGVAQGDPVVIATVTASLALVALIACAVPALRATRIAPTVALTQQ